MPSGGARRIFVTMNDAHPSPGAGISRRHLIAGLGAASGAAGLLASLPGGSVVAGPVAPALGASPARFPEALAPLVPSLTYVHLDAYAFFNAETNAPHPNRLVDNLTGANPVPTPGSLVAPLPVPSGAQLKQINLSYLGTPSVQIWLRPLEDPRNEQSLVNETLPMHMGADPRAESIAVDLPVTQSVTYSLRVSCSPGTSVFGATVGYELPSTATGPLGIVPIDPPTRPLDTRQPGPQQGKLAAGEERVVQLGLPDGAAGAIINLTITQTETDFGYVSVYRAGIPWPGNSSINWSSPELTAANGVITAVDDQGRITIRGGEAATHVVIDLVGALV